MAAESLDQHCTALGEIQISSYHHLHRLTFHKKSQWIPQPCPQTSFQVAFSYPRWWIQLVRCIPDIYRTCQCWLLAVWRDYEMQHPQHGHECTPNLCPFRIFISAFLANLSWAPCNPFWAKMGSAQRGRLNDRHCRSPRMYVLPIMTRKMGIINIKWFWNTYLVHDDVFIFNLSGFLKCIHINRLSRCPSWIQCRGGL